MEFILKSIILLSNIYSTSPWTNSCMSVCGHFKCNLLIAQARPRMIQHLSSIFSIFWQEVVDSVPYITGSCKMVFSISYIPCLQHKLLYMFTNNIACLQWKLPCVFTNNNVTRTNQRGECNRWTTVFMDPLWDHKSISTVVYLSLTSFVLQATIALVENRLGLSITIYSTLPLFLW